MRSWADYLYTPGEFVYAGKQFHAQKNHVNRFYRENPSARLVLVTAENRDRVSAFLNTVLEKKQDMSDWERGEVEGTRDLLYLAEPLRQIGAFLDTDNGIASFAMGEIRGDTLHIHAEKANPDFHGAYPAIAAAFAAYAGKNVIYINREDDAGDLGIRYSKEQYRPVAMIQKYCVQYGD